MKTSETKPEFAGSEDDVRQEIPSRPIRDPSLDGLLIGLEERLDHGPGSGAKLRAHTPPNAHTDPFPEEPVVAPHLTAPLSAVIAEKVQGRPRTADAPSEPARPSRLHDPTYVLDREPTMTRRAWMIVGACGVVVVGALGLAGWATTRVGDMPATNALPAVEPPPTEPPLAASLPVAALPSAGLASALAVSPAPVASAAVAPRVLPSASRTMGTAKTKAPPAEPGETLDRGIK